MRILLSKTVPFRFQSLLPFWGKNESKMHRVDAEFFLENSFMQKSLRVWGATAKFRKPPGLYFSKVLFEGFIFGGAYVRTGLSMEGNLRFKIDWASLIVGRKYRYLRAIFKYKSPEGLYLEGRFNGGIFALRLWGAYFWRGLFSEFYSIKIRLHP